MLMKSKSSLTYTRETELYRYELKIPNEYQLTYHDGVIGRE